MATLPARGGLEGRERVYILPRVNPPFQNSPYIPPSPPTVTPSLTPQPLLLIIIIIMGGGGVVISGRRSQTVVLRRQKTAEWLFVSSPAGRRGRRGEVGRGEVREGGEEGGGQQSPGHKHWEQPSRWSSFYYSSSSLFIQMTRHLWIKNISRKKNA